MKLSQKQIAFCENYVACGNATLAAEKAGYSKKTARQVGSENLSKPYISDYIKELQNKIESKKIMTAKERQELLSDIARDRFKETADRIRAIDTLNKMTGEYIQRVEANVNSTNRELQELLEQRRKRNVE